MRIVVFRRRWLTALGCLVAAVAMFGVVTNPAAIGAAATQRQLPIYAVEENPQQKQAALTFDAAWGNEDTEELIEILKRYDVPATFFLVGQWVDKYPESVRALAEAGHEIGNHSDTHPHLTQCDGETILAELERCNEKVKTVIGKEPKLHRCPFGDYDDKVIQSVRSIGMEPVQWNVERSHTAESAGAATLFADLRKGAGAEKHPFRREVGKGVSIVSSAQERASTASSASLRQFRMVA